MIQKRRVIYMTDPEWANLQLQAEASGRSASGIIRAAIAALLSGPYPHIPDPRQPQQFSAQQERDAILKRVNRKTGE